MSACALHHEEAGQGGVPVVLGGSLGSTLAMWDPQMAALAGERRVIRYDLRGHGGSPAPDGSYEICDLGRDVLALLDHLAIERASYCGLSIGAMAGMWLAAHAPERIDRLVLLCTAAYMPPASAWGERAASVRAAGTPEVVADAVVGLWLTPAYAQEHPETVAWLRAMFGAVSPAGYAGCCEALGRMDLRPDLERIAAPTIVIAGEQDPSAGPGHARAIAAAIPGARLEILSPAAHLASVEQAQTVTALIADHLDSREGP